MPRKKEKPVCQLYIALVGIKPEIWRRFRVSSDITLDRLHQIIQGVMGWENCHLHQFIVGDRYYGVPQGESMPWGPKTRDEGGARLRQIVSGEGDQFSYEYDFGDSWEHVLEVEKIIPADEAGETPLCIDGEMACPPEDCGGRFGYARIQKYFKDPESVDPGEPWSMVVKDFDPEEFDLEEVNRWLESFRQ
ncbi:MAG: plasmid pRiA4b ORF-3 family protein [Planctomycetota bacterium]